ncbi:MAG TPA: XRE family transcriptional regulator [Solirubrobacteraceae bacterium]|nr:XRE family transcriptional regulator [Solirubrobacteraceae bacterium]
MAPFNYSRVDLARRRRGLTKAKLAEEVGVSPRMLRKYEHAESEPSSLTIQRMADVLGFPAPFFYGDTLDEPVREGVSFRSLSSLTERKGDQALASGALALALSDWIEARFELPTPDVPQYEGTNPETAAAAVREAWGLGERPVTNVVHLLEAHGVRVFSLDEGSNLDGFSFWRGEKPFVFLNVGKTVEHSRMDAAHELGHLVLHAHGGPGGREAEREAFAFGAAFLMPKGSIVAKVPQGASLQTLIESKSYWRVSALALARRVYGVGLISEWQYRSICIALSKYGKTNEPEPLRMPETSQVLGKVVQALRAESVSQSSIAADLCIPLDELSKSVFGHMLRSMEGGAESSAAMEPTPEPEHRRQLRIV